MQICLVFTIPVTINGANLNYTVLLYTGTMCPIKQELLNGVVTVSGIRLGSTAHYTCNDGYTLVGPATRECLISGTWSGYTPVCLANNTSRSNISGALCS